MTSTTLVTFSPCPSVYWRRDAGLFFLSLFPMFLRAEPSSHSFFNNTHVLSLSVSLSSCYIGKYGFSNSRQNDFDILTLIELTELEQCLHSRNSNLFKQE
jgi:hypothetical protein